MRQELIKNNHTKLYLSRGSEEISECSEHFIPEETGQDSGIDGSVKDVAVAIIPEEQIKTFDYSDACEAEVYFGTQVIL